MVNGASYVGSAVDLTRRFRDYFSEVWLKKEVLKHNSIIYRALLKYGFSNFRLEILEGPLFFYLFLFFFIICNIKKKRAPVNRVKQYYASNTIWIY